MARNGQLFGLGSTSAIELCKRFEIDPHAKMPDSQVQEIARLCDKKMNDETQEASETCLKMWQHIEAAIGND